MGQRHQVFIIAKLQGKYRTVAAIHHQWLYGRTAVRQCLHTCKVLQANASLIRQDLQAGARLDWTKLREMKDTRSIFPIVTTALVVGVGHHGESNYSANVHTIPIQQLPSQQDNNDGFTVLDATNPDHIRYCFFFQHDAEPLANNVEWDNEGNERETSSMYPQLQANVPLTASEYFSAYYKLDSVEGVAAADNYRELETFSLIDAATLHDAWPGEGFDSSEPQTVPQSTQPSQSGDTASLRQITLDEVIEKAIHSDPSDLSWLSTAEQLPDFAQSLKARLQREPSLVNPAILGRAFLHETDLDFTPFDGLSATGMLETISHTNLSKAKELNVMLPMIDDLSIDHLRTLLSRWTLRELHLGQTTEIPLQTLQELLSESSLQTFTHPALFQTDLDFHASHVDPLLTLAPEARPSHPLCQVLYLRRAANDNAKYIDTLSTDGQRILAWSENVRLIGWGFEQDASMLVPLPMQDVQIQPSELLKRLPSALYGLLSAGEFDFVGFKLSTTGTGIAKALAIDNEYKLSPVPASIHSAYQQLGRNNITCLPKIPDLSPGEWTLFITHEVFRQDFSTHYTTALRYAFVTRDDAAGHQPVIRDLQGFLEELAKVRKSGDLTSMSSSSSSSSFLQGLADKAFPTSATTHLPVEVERCHDLEVEELIKAIGTHDTQIEEQQEMMRKFGML